MNKSKEKIKENPIVANRAIYMANPCHIIDKVVPLYWHNSYTNEKSSDNHRLSELFSLDYQDSNLDKQNQNLLCYHYTIVQTYVLSVKKRCKDRGLQANLQIFRSLFYFAPRKSRIITSQSANNSSFYHAEQADISRRAGQQL